MNKISSYLIIPVLTLVGLMLGLISRWILDDAVLNNQIWMVTMLIGTTPLIYRMIKDIWRGHFGVDLIAIVAIIASFVLHQYLAGIVIVLMLSGGEALESYALNRAKRELSSLLAQAPTHAHIEKQGQILEVNVWDVKKDDIIIIKPGEIVPADGLVISGESELDESALTGESVPVLKQLGSMVFSGSVNKGSVFNVKVLHPASESKYEQIIKLVRQAEENRAPIVRLADKHSVWFTIITFTIAIITWFVSHDPIRLLAVLVVATPCPLILATPITMISGISKSASRGIIIKHGGALEKLAEVRAFIFDKTGTLTLGMPEIEKAVGFEIPDSEILQISASLDQMSMHILARSLQKYALTNNVKLSIPNNFKEDFGKGVSGELSGSGFLFGKLQFLRDNQIPISDGILESHELMQNQGKISVYLANKYKILGVVIFSDIIRPEIKNLFQDLKRQGLNKIIMLTGDKLQVASRIANELGVDDVYAEALPEDKVFQVKDHQRQFGKVAMIGDGINDAPALATADVGIALGGHGSSASSESGDIVITVDNLARVGEAFKLSKRVLTVAKQGIFFGIGVSICLMIIASFGFIAPVYGALLQEALDVVVILNALRVSLS